VQVGVFGDKANADRIASRLGGLGTVSTTEVARADTRLWSVRVNVADPAAAEAVMAAAAEAGATGAYRIAR
jgi:hypothetical protein